ncbi:MAG: S8 family peptidase [Candidatus Pacebacteria bacterium]|nr:S8 family peptidase [Candidatus Paceibacterota bacterium]
MKINYLSLFVIALVSVGLLPIISSASYESGRKIIVYTESVSVAEREALSETLRSNRIKRLRGVFQADVVENLTSAELRTLERDIRVKRIDDDVIVYALDLPSQLERYTRRRPILPSAPVQSQILPWGIDRVDAELVWPEGNTGNPIKVGVIDTGINLYHPDLKENIKGQYNAIRTRKSAEDDNGHGSHVAGTIAALQNNIGVVGVGPDIDLYAIKVLNSRGSGYLSDIIEGIDFAINSNLDVINMSLGTGSNVQSFHDAVIRAYDAGIVVVAAAGNSGGAVLYPAAYSEAIAVSATDSNNNIASFSSRGPEIDIAAPGVSIYSTYKRKGYKTLSGTSMAAPHVAGAAALVLETAPGAYDTNGNSKWDPEEVKNKLQDTATDLGASGFDNLFGWGLVNAYAATQ